MGSHQENDYQEHVFLDHLRHLDDRQSQKIWHEHQGMQLQFLRRHGLGPGSNVLDLGCGPMRLGSALIPLLKNGWYFGQDLNPETLVYGEEVLRQVGIGADSNYTLIASDQFDLAAVNRPIQIAFSNSLFSHLNLNSIHTCLLRLREVLVPGGVYYSTFFSLEAGANWLQPLGRNKWGQAFDTFPHQDPYHYPPALLAAVASQAGYRMSLMPDFGHPTQTMARFRLGRRLWF
ncbi:bifunctional 2-polyprenyl-6-hydroxyphenol methylase/3-demethylubiquinol 3-O-methyltransferase UbiG [Cyanobium sp. WAJ14-Wanaka]|uniref:class I SAM-dependent methyltransferase n=1 Tax=Cyanobium sp. WAJ14-Wanaka TaxID=2823725 RepID=UPI0020CDDBDD|nr:class I SAM-dependent methyltransferase [Cyanobium sp. WAJ14-Wanaka]MCP9775632.1 class I SAM-dependent methyltransferase [Cyanobium sp. WAJ14-Wanaka]